MHRGGRLTWLEDRSIGKFLSGIRIKFQANKPMQTSLPVYLSTLPIVIPAQAGIHRISAVHFNASYSECNDQPLGAASAANSLAIPALYTYVMQNAKSLQFIRE